MGTHQTSKLVAPEFDNALSYIFPVRCSRNALNLLMKPFKRVTPILWQWPQLNYIRDSMGEIMMLRLKEPFVLRHCIKFCLGIKQQCIKPENTCGNLKGPSEDEVQVLDVCDPSHPDWFGLVGDEWKQQLHTEKGICEMESVCVKWGVRNTAGTRKYSRAKT